MLLRDTKEDLKNCKDKPYSCIGRFNSHKKDALLS